jgi:regulator of nucleoside diphosphate kinase
VKRSPIFISEYDHHRLRALLAETGNAKTQSALVRELSDELDRALIVPGHARVPTFVVTLDSRVAYEDHDTGEIVEATLVLPDAAGARTDAISILDAAGVALLGYAPGDVVHFSDGDRVRRIRIREVVQSSLAEAGAALSIS